MPSIGACIIARRFSLESGFPFGRFFGTIDDSVVEEATFGVFDKLPEIKSFPLVFIELSFAFVFEADCIFRRFVGLESFPC